MSLPPTIWGSHFWKTLHFITIGYPLNPSKKDKTNISNIINSLETILPCGECRTHYKYNLKHHPLTDDILSIKLKLIVWMHELHNIVNRLTGKEMPPFEYAMVRLFTDDHGRFTEEHLREHQHAHEHPHEHQHEHPHEHPHEHQNAKKGVKKNDIDVGTLSLETAMNYYKIYKRNGIDGCMVNLDEVYGSYQEDIEKQKKMEEDLKKGEEIFKKLFSDEKYAEVREREKKAREEYLKMIESKNPVFKFESQTTIDVGLLINNFVDAIQKENNLDKKKDMITGFKTILECF
jgi:hypothetical protein